MSNSIAQFALLSVHNNRLKRITRASAINIIMQWTAFVLEEEFRYEWVYQDSRRNDFAADATTKRIFPFLILLQSIFTTSCVLSCVLSAMCPPPPLPRNRALACGCSGT